MNLKKHENMKKLLTTLCALALSVTIYGGGVVEYSWTSGVSFPESDNDGNYNAHWFTFVAPFSGNVKTIRLALGTKGERKDAYIAISHDLKEIAANFTKDDFIAISNESSTTSGSDKTFTFDNAELIGGATYYCYFLTEENGSYTTKSQRFCVSETSGRMSIKPSNSDATTNSYTIPFEGTMTLKESAQYRIKGYKPKGGEACWIQSKDTDEDVLYKTEVSSVSINDLLTNTRYLWNVLSDNGVKLQNIGKNHYIPTITVNSNAGDGNVKFLTATGINDAAVFTVEDGLTVDNGNKIGEVKLKTSYGAGDTWLNTFSVNTTTVGVHNVDNFTGSNFLFQQVKTVTFNNEPVAVNGGEEVMVIYLAADGSDIITLPADYTYIIDGQDELHAVEAAAAIAAYGAKDINVTVNENPAREIFYKLVWDNAYEPIITAPADLKNGEYASEHLPSEMNNDCVTLSYSPEVLEAGINEIIVTATWSGPFQLSDADAPKYYTVGIHSNRETDNNILQNRDGNLFAQSVQTDAYAELSDDNLFYFSGNPYDGITITSKNGGIVNKNNDGSQATIGKGNSTFIPVAAKPDVNKTVADGYVCFQVKDVKDGRNFLNCDVNDENKIKGYDQADAGSTCWFIPAGQYYLNYMDKIGINAPVGAVGTTECITEEIRTQLLAQNSAIQNNLYGELSAYATAKGLLDPIANSDVIELQDGYYRVVNAVPGFNNTAAWYYDATVAQTRIRWAKAATTDAQQINSLFKFVAKDDAWTIYSPNAEQFITTGNGRANNTPNAELGEVDNVQITSLGSAQFNITQTGNNNPLHALNHSSGGGNNGDLIIWAGGLNSASAWYIVKVEKVTVALNEINGTRYATLYAPFAYTVEGATAYTLTLNEQRTSLLLHKVEGYVPAGTAVVLISEQNATATLTLAPEHDDAAALPTALTGTYTAQAISAGAESSNYFLGKLSDVPGFYKYSGESLNLAANRAYLKMGSENASNGFSLTLSDDDITAIIDAVSSANGAPHYYDLQGRRVAAPQKGRIYIVNGKKTIF